MLADGIAHTPDHGELIHLAPHAGIRFIQSGGERGNAAFGNAAFAIAAFGKGAFGIVRHELSK